METGAQQCDLMICVTESDELNILADLVAKQIKTKHMIARVRNPDYSKQRDFMQNQLGFSLIINPELKTTHEIRRALSFPSAIKVDTFAKGKVELTEFYAAKHSRLHQIPLIELHRISKTNILVCAVRRNGNLSFCDYLYSDCF